MPYKTLNIKPETYNQLIFYKHAGMSFDDVLIGLMKIIPEKEFYAYILEEHRRRIKKIKIEVGPPAEYKLEQNYPNPFNPSTTISYQLPHASKVNLGIYNLLGQQVAMLINQIQDAGSHEIEWNAKNLASGMYIYQLHAKGENGSNYFMRKKMVLLK